MCTAYSRLRDEHGAHYGRLVGVREVAYPTAACDVSASVRHPPRATRFDSWGVQWSKLDRAEGETSAGSGMRPGLHAVSLGSPIGTASKEQIFALTGHYASQPGTDVYDIRRAAC